MAINVVSFTLQYSCICCVLYPFIDVERKALTRFSEWNSSLKTEAQQDDRDLKTGDIVNQASSSTHRGTEGG